jgi:prepilin-type processing-associated H-X9-DG protein
MTRPSRRRLGAEFWVGLLVLLGIVAVMVPILRRARQTARMVRCRQHLSLLFRGVQAYTLNNAGMLPQQDWRAVVDPLVEPARPRDGRSPRWQCPEGGSYVGNIHVFRSGRPLGDSRFERSVGLLADGVDPLPPAAIGRYSRIAWRHRDGANVLFLDGHVEYVRRTESARIRRYWNDPEQEAVHASRSGGR